MEPAGLAVGILGLAGVFSNAVDCFEYVQLGRNFSTNFQTSLLKLDNARLRLSRWGEALGVNGNYGAIQTLQQTTFPEEDVKRADELLGQILHLFDEAQKASEQYKRKNKSDGSSLAVLDVQAEMDSAGQSLHEKMRSLCIKRQKKTSLKQKAKWVLYEEKYLNRLVEDIVSLVDDLTELFPTVQQEQQKLCEAEVSELAKSEGSNESLELLLEIVQSQDKDLKAALAAAMKPDQSNPGATFRNDNCNIGNQAQNVAIHGGQNFHFLS
ncbi:uncharacterized protein SETTUDRAFT_162498 [Exserohilum turcica Et28A]|uniref:Prion-inhibition and propagation HeLo domain-containing protein n=1 Tax=Exserohilum turcicum (strain 28A) TaxID=671987 RepID=R0KW11_EXST2|nr:uncharacterized protein SETTUDRAFT_162498 [Exserohilum turcica Et28A]EOA91947.1 hypothetical protein SETTUDRAFT_162498 [Exserohilum turcica Et28A]